MPLRRLIEVSCLRRRIRGQGLGPAGGRPPSPAFDRTSTPRCLSGHLGLPFPDVADLEPDEPQKTGPEDDDAVDLDQIIERLSWSPAERLRYLLDMLAFEERASKARPIA